MSASSTKRRSAGLRWFRDLEPQERRTFWACLTGWAVDAMDAQLYAVIIPTLLVLWHMTPAQAGSVSTAALISSGLGGWLAGVLCDRIGRVRVLQMTVLWFSVFTFLSGLATDYWQLLAARVMQGFGFGGEWAAGAVLISEVVQARHRGKVVGMVQAGWAIGYGCAVLLYLAVFSLLPVTVAWRVLFVLGVAPALLVIYLRRFVREPEIYLRETGRRDGAASVRAIFAPPLLKRTLLATLLVFGIMGATYTVVTWLPTYLSRVRGLSVAGASGYLLVNIVGSFCGYLVSALLTDAVGRRRTFVSFAFGAAVVVPIYMFGAVGPTTILFMGWVLGFFQSGTLGGTAAFLAELFPTSVRGAAQGFAYNMGRGLGSALPALVGLANEVMPLSRAIGVSAMGAYSVVVLVVLLLPETRGVDRSAGTKNAGTGATGGPDANVGLSVSRTARSSRT